LQLGVLPEKKVREKATVGAEPVTFPKTRILPTKQGGLVTIEGPVRCEMRLLEHCLPKKKKKTRWRSEKTKTLREKGGKKREMTVGGHTSALSKHRKVANLEK